MSKLYILRHGETEWNRLTKLQGRQDIPLNETGRRQAAAVAKYFEDIPVAAVYSSPLSRARETAKIISDIHGFGPVMEKVHLVERDFGHASGYTAEERQGLYPDGKYPGIEDYDALCQRMLSTLTEIAQAHEQQPVLIVSHGAAINAVLNAVSKGAVGSGKTILDSCCINLLSYTDQGLTVEFYNHRAY